MDFLSFENRAFSVHGGKYDYSRVDLVSSKSKVEIVCPEHGPFFQTPDHHMRGRGCPTCARQVVRRKVSTLQEFVEEASSIHRGFYDYSLSEFTSPSAKVKIVCPVHGEFETLARKHLWEKRGCPECGRVRGKYHSNVSFQDFFDAAVERHGYNYSYSEVEIAGARGLVTLVCPTHGRFRIGVSAHLQGAGCPGCRPSGSTPENELAEFIRAFDVDVVRNSKRVIPPFEIDILVPDRHIAFEFNGVFWHSEQRGKTAEYHRNKTLRTLARGFRLFHVYDSDWDLNQDTVKARIQAVMNPFPCPPEDETYCILREDGAHCLIHRSKVICAITVQGNFVTHVDTTFSLEAVSTIMKFFGVSFFREDLDWPQFSLEEYGRCGFRIESFLPAQRVLFDKRTSIRLKESVVQGGPTVSVFNSGYRVWRLY